MLRVTSQVSTAATASHGHANLEHKAQAQRARLRTTLPIVQLRAQATSERRIHTTKISLYSQSSTLGAGRSHDRPPTVTAR